MNTIFKLHVVIYILFFSNNTTSTSLNTEIVEQGHVKVYQVIKLPQRYPDRVSVPILFCSVWPVEVF